MITYRSPKIEVRKETTEGLGVVTRKAISKDEIVAIKAGRIVTRDDIKQITDEVGDFALQIEDDFYLSPTTLEEIDQMTVFINHSCDPNVGFRGQCVYVAIRDIAPGEELCHDYSMERSDDYHLQCDCGSDLCRGKVTGDDWKLPELQNRYRGYFSLYLENKIDGV